MQLREQILVSIDLENAEGSQECHGPLLCGCALIVMRAYLIKTVGTKMHACRGPVKEAERHSSDSLKEPDMQLLGSSQATARERKGPVMHDHYY